MSCGRISPAGTRMIRIPLKVLLNFLKISSKYAVRKRVGRGNGKRQCVFAEELTAKNSPRKNVSRYRPIHLRPMFCVTSRRSEKPLILMTWAMLII